MTGLMDALNVLVLADPAAPYLGALSQIAPPVSISTGQELEFARAAAPTADVIFTANFQAEPFSSIFPLARCVRWVHSLSAGVENILTPEFVSSSVPLTNAQGVFKDSLAEFAIAGMLFFAKDLRRMLRNQEAGRWEQFNVGMLRGATLGVVGYGGIGREAGALAHALGMRVLALRRRPALSQEDATLDAGYAPDRLREMLALCDYVLAAAPLTPQTQGMLGRPEFAAMKPSAVFLNVGRGPVVVEAALIEALETGRIRGAALDVFEREPLPEGHAFYRLPNVLLSPHCADRTVGWIELAVAAFLENFERFRAGQPLKNIVDKKAGY